MRIATKLFGLFALSVAALGCGDQLTTQEAYTACEELFDNRLAEPTDEEFAACVACHEDCGPTCEVSGDEPPAFTCPEE